MKNYTYWVVLQVGILLTLFCVPFLCFAQTPLEQSLEKLTYKELDSIGKELRNNSKFYEAEPYLKKALQKIEKSNGKDSLYAVACFELGIVYSYQRKYIQTESLFLEAKEIQEKVVGKNNVDYARYCNALGILYKNQGIYSKSESLYLESLKIKETLLGKKSIEYAKTCINLGSLYSKQKLYLKAEYFHKNIRETFKDEKYSSLSFIYLNSCIGLANTYKSMANYKSAEKLYLEVIDLQNENTELNRYENTVLYSNLGELYIWQELYDSAEEIFIKLKEINKNMFSEQHQSYFITVNNLASLYFHQKLYQKAELLYKELRENQESQVKLLFPIYSESEKQEYYSAHSNFFTNFIDFATYYYSTKNAISGDIFNQQLFTKGVIFSSTQKIKNQILDSKDGVLKNQYEKWQEDKQNYISLLQTPISERDSTIDMQQIASDINELEREISKKSELFKENTEQTEYTWKDVKQNLSSNEAAIEIIRLVRKTVQDKPKDTVYVALILTDQTKEYPEFLVLENGRELETEARAYYQNTTEFQLEDTESYNQYWKPIQDVLDSLSSDGYSKIYVSPDGIYHQLNLNTLRNPKTGRYLIDQQTLQLITSSRDLINKKENTLDLSANYEAYTAFLFGYPAYNKNSFDKQDTIKTQNSDRSLNGLQRVIGQQKAVPMLEGTKLETNKINVLLTQKGFSSRLFQNENASEEELKAIDNPTILHIATHGFFIDEIRDSKVTTMQEAEDRNLLKNPLLRSGLLLAGCQNPQLGQEDGVLSAEEAMNLHLNKTELVVLSACETALGDIQNGEGVYGLQRAFRQAGAKTLLMSLWKVDDTSTELLMVYFYENLLKGQDKRVAFRNAQLKLKESYPNPYYWGAFIMVGE